MGGEARYGRIPGLATGAVVPAACAAAALGVVSAYSPKIALAVLVAVGFFVLAVRRLDLGVATFVVLTFPEHLPGTLGAGATLAKPVGALILLAWAFRVVRREPARLLPRDRPVLFGTIVAFLLFGGVSVLWATDRGALGYELGRLLQVAALLLVAYTATSTRSGFRTVVWGYLLGSVATALYSIASGAYHANRLAGLFDPNYFAASLIPALLIALFLVVSTDSRRTRALAAAVALVDLVAFVLTQSRGGIAGLAVALVVAVVVAGRARPRVVAVFLVVVAGGLAYYLGVRPAHVVESFAGGVSGASSGRADEWKIALHMLEGHPLGGVGLGNYTVVEPSYATHTFNLLFVQYDVTKHLAAHNTYLEVAAELGVVGILLFLAVLALPLRGAARVLRGLGQRLDPLEFHVRGLVAGACGMFVAYVFLSAEWEKQLWLVLALLAGAAAMATSDSEEPEREIAESA